MALNGEGRLSDWKATARALMWLCGFLVAALGAMLGHITTKDAINSELSGKYVPRYEIDARLSNIEHALERIEKKVEEP